MIDKSPVGEWGGGLLVAAQLVPWRQPLSYVKVFDSFKDLRSWPQFCYSLLHVIRQSLYTPPPPPPPAAQGATFQV